MIALKIDRTGRKYIGYHCAASWPVNSGRNLRADRPVAVVPALRRWLAHWPQPARRLRSFNALAAPGAGALAAVKPPGTAA